MDSERERDDPRQWVAYYGVRSQFEEMLELGRAFAARLDEVRNLVSQRDTADAGGVWQEAVSVDDDSFFSALVSIGIAHQTVHMPVAKLLHPEWWDDETES